MDRYSVDEKYVEKRRQLLKEMLFARGLNNDSDIFDRMGEANVAGIFQQ